MMIHYLNDKRLMPEDKGVLAYLCSKPMDYKHSTKDIVSVMNCGIKKIQHSLNRLEEIGYIERIVVKNDNGKFGCYKWNIYEFIEID